MENVYKLLRMAFNVIVFFMAITLLYAMYHQFNALVDKSADNVAGDTLIYETAQSEGEYYITRTELISLLLEGLEYDLEVVDEAGTYTIISEGYSPSQIGLYSFTSDKYEKSYSYHLNGEISKIKFYYVTG